MITPHLWIASVAAHPSPTPSACATRVARAAACTRLLAREAFSSGYPRISGSKGAILLHRRNNCYAPIGTGNGGGDTARFGLARGRSLRRRYRSLALPMPARIYAAAVVVGYADRWSRIS